MNSKISVLRNAGIIILFSGIVMSCSESPKEETQKLVEDQAEKEERVLQGYQDQLQKAKDAEKLMLDAAERQKKAIDDDTQ